MTVLPRARSKTNNWGCSVKKIIEWVLLASGFAYLSQRVTCSLSSGFIVKDRQTGYQLALMTFTLLISRFEDRHLPPEPEPLPFFPIDRETPDPLTSL